MAAEGSVTYGSSSYSPTEGQEFQIGVYVNGSEAIGAYEFYLDYNADMMEYISGADSGGGGRLKFTGYGDASSYKYMLTFRAKKAGSSNVTISNVYLGPLSASSGDSMTITAAASAPVNIQGPSTASDVCRLAELNISPTGLWGFAPDKTEYDITVDNDISKLAITAKAESDKASVSISDTNLAVGVNTIKIKVTAENGTVKTYSIIVRRKEAQSQPQTTTAAQDPDIENLSVSFMVNGKDMYVTEKVDGIEAPDGFQKTIVSYQGQEIPAFTSLTQNITLFYLRDGLGENGAFYAYNSARDNVYPYIRLSNATGSYMVISPEADVKAPEGYNETTLALGNGGDENVATSIQAWIQGSDTEFFLIYALNDKGECDFYQYDSKEKTLQRFHSTGMVIPSEPSETTSAKEEPGRVEELESEIIKQKLSNQIDTKNKLMIIIVLAVFCVVLIIAVIGLLFKLKGQADDRIYADEEDMDNEDMDNLEELKEPEEIEEIEEDLEEPEEVSYVVESAKEMVKEAAAAKEPRRRKEPEPPVKQTAKTKPEPKRKPEPKPEPEPEPDLDDDDDFLLDLDDDDFTFFDYDEK